VRHADLRARHQAGIIHSFNLFMVPVNWVACPAHLTIAQSFLVTVIFVRCRPFSPRGRSAAGRGAPHMMWLPPADTVLDSAFVMRERCSLRVAGRSSQQIVVTGTILCIYLLFLWGDAFGQSMGDRSTQPAKASKFGLDQRRREQLALPISLTLKLAILCLSVPLIMLQWGFDWQAVSEWLGQLLFGFQVGNMQISVAAIFAAVIVFVVGYMAAKLFQGWFDRNVLAAAGISGGARDSIRTGIGYVGVIVAAMLAFSYAGFNFSNLAIVAGALSVGIGFGRKASSAISCQADPAGGTADQGWRLGGGRRRGRIVRKIGVRSTKSDNGKANVII
jgi:small-conductance mechanosensitive channel